MAHVPFTDASGLSAFEKTFSTLKKYGGKIIFSGTKERIASDIKALVTSLERTDMVYFAKDFDEAVALASS